MVASTEFLPWATSGGANVASQASFAAGAWRTAGFLTGVAESNQVNKGLRQSLFMSACVATFVAETLAIAVNDDGDLPAAVDNLEAALAAFTRASVWGVFGVAGGTANALTVATTPARPALVDGEFVFVRISTLSTGAATLNRDGLGAKAILRPDGAALESGDLPAGSVILAVYQAAANSYILTAIPNGKAVGGLRNATMLTGASGNHIVAAGVTRLYAETVGAGGGGGGSTGAAGAGGGGGGGGWAAGFLDVTPGQSIPWVNGAKGAGSSGTGGNGGTTSFNSGAVAAGGGSGGQGGGAASTGNGGTPGGFIAGDIGLTGAQGDAGSSNGAYAIAGRGGDAARGGGAGGAPAGPAPGRGGGGGGAINTTAGDGGDGITFVFW